MKYPRTRETCARSSLRIPCSLMPSLRSAFRSVLALTALLAASGCGPRETPAEKALATDTLLLSNAAEPSDLDPQLMTAYTDGNIMMALFEGLTALDEQSLQAVPSSAEK